MRLVDIIVGREFPKKVIPLIESARQSVEIVVFDWRWYPNDPGASVQLFNQAIVRAARRGVRVRALVNNDSVALVLRENGVDAQRITSKRLLHCKFMVVDREVLVTGSHNYTESAFQMNFELSAIVREPEAALVVCAFFESLFIKR